MKITKLKRSGWQLLSTVLLFFRAGTDGAIEGYKYLCPEIAVGSAPLDSTLDDTSIGARAQYNPVIDGFTVEPVTPDEPFEVTVVPVRVHNTYLQGWLLVRIARTKFIWDPLLYVVINAEDENGMAFGEFVDVPCQISHQVTASSLLPCVGTPANEPLHPLAFVYNQATQALDYEVIVYWKYSQNYCNKKKKFLFRAHILQQSDISKKRVSVANRYWIYPNDDYRASDPFPTRISALFGCSGKYEEIGSATWFHLDDPIEKITNSTIPTVRCGFEQPGQTYVGRCADVKNPKIRINGDENNELVCSQQADKNNYTSYDKYVAERFRFFDKYSYSCCPALSPSLTCPIPTTTMLSIDTTSESPLTQKDNPKDNRILNVCDKSTISICDRVWKMRMFHTIVMSIATFFVIPVNLFMTRYYKETFMHTRINYCLIWSFVHYLSIPITGVLFLLGLYSISRAQDVVGHSLSNAANVHRGVGWTVIIIFIITSIIGGVRLFEDLYRRISMAFHWLCGILIYIGLLVLVVQSISIPGSPSKTYATEGSDSEGLSHSTHTLVIIVVVWLFVECSFHVLLSFHIYLMDQRLGLDNFKRIYTPVMIPIMHDLGEEDLPGHGIRYIALGIYLVISFSMTLCVCTTMSIAVPTGLHLGLMSCIHEPSGSLLNVLDTDYPCQASRRWFL